MDVQTRAAAPPYHAYQDGPLPPRSCTPSYQQRLGHLQSLSLPTNHTLQASTSSNAYMNPTLPQPPSQYSFQPSLNHGVKRSAPDLDDELERSSHISTQFKKLRLNNQQRQQQQQQQPYLHPTDGNDNPVYTHHHAQPPPQFHQYHQQQSNTTTITPSSTTPPTLPANDFMTLDETPSKIYIPSLDEEIRSIEAAEQASQSIFLPDFDKQIGAIPDHILRSSRPAYNNSSGESSRDNSQALVLYRDPSSISVPEEEDAVRKAIAETRRGFRERMRRESQRERETAHITLAEGVHKGGGSEGFRQSPLSGRYENQGENYNIQDTRHALDDGDAMDLE